MCRAPRDVPGVSSEGFGHGPKVTGVKKGDSVTASFFVGDATQPVVSSDPLTLEKDGNGTVRFDFGVDSGELPKGKYSVELKLSGSVSSSAKQSFEIK